jgi:hypothetical protein
VVTNYAPYVAPRRRAGLWQRPPLIMLAAPPIVLFPVAYLSQEMWPRLSLTIACLAAIGVVVIFDFGMKALAPDLLVPRILSAACGLQLVWIVVAAITDATIDPGFQMGRLNLAERPMTTTLPLLLIPLSAFAAVLCVSAVTRPVSRINIWKATVIPPKGLEIYLLIGAFVHVAYWPATSESSGVPGFFVRIAHTSLVYMPLFVGRYSRVLRKAAGAWLFAMAISFFLGIATGSRFDALVPPVLFMIGRISSSPPALRRKAITVTAAMLVVFLGISGLTGIVRSEVGRGRDEHGNLLSMDRLNRAADAAGRVFTSSSGDDEDRVGSTAVARMITWANFASTRFTPDPVAYKGWSDFGQQARLVLFDVALISGSTLQDRIDLGVGTAAAKAYGYIVTDKNSVDFGLLGDGWSRAGILGVLILGFALACFMSVLERFLPLIGKLAPAAPLFIIMVWITNALAVLVLPFLSLVRAVVLPTVYFGCIVMAVEGLRSAFRQRRVRQFQRSR